MIPYYNQDGITIYHADCLEVLADMPSKSIDMVLTDPPYGLGLDIANDKPDQADPLVKQSLVEAARILKPAGVCCYCCGGGYKDDPSFARWAIWMNETVGFKQAIIWDKNRLGWGMQYRRSYEMVLVGERPGEPKKWYGGHQQADIVRIDPVVPEQDGHPTPKPPGLMRMFVKLHTAFGDIVLDPFMGTGTTLLAAQQLGRRAIGVDIDIKHVETAARRLSQREMLLGE